MPGRLLGLSPLPSDIAIKDPWRSLLWPPNLQCPSHPGLPICYACLRVLIIPGSRLQVYWFACHLWPLLLGQKLHEGGAIGLHASQSHLPAYVSRPCALSRRPAGTRNSVLLVTVTSPDSKGQLSAAYCCLLWYDLRAKSSFHIFK